MTATFLLTHWRTILTAVVVTGLSIALALSQASSRHWHKRYEQEAALHALDIATWRKAADEAHAADLQHAATVKARDDAITHEVQNDLQAKLETARAVAADYARRMRVAAAANPGGVQNAGASAATDPAGGVAGAGADALVPVTADDVGICAENSVKAAGWLAWWQRVSVEAR